MNICLAVTCHDPSGGFATGVAAAAEQLRSEFGAIAVNATEETSQRTIDALKSETPGARFASHQAGSIGIGTARRDALALALETDCDHILYSDLDHVLRWAAIHSEELRETLARACDADFTVIGRSPETFEREPARLRATEGAVNRAASLALGHTGQEPWDFMIATRLMSRGTAQILVDEVGETSIASDVAWPLHAHGRGLSLSYRPVQGLAYRFREDFGAERDERDQDPLEWVRRLEIAALHASAMRPYLEAVSC